MYSNTLLWSVIALLTRHLSCVVSGHGIVCSPTFVVATHGIVIRPSRHFGRSMCENLSVYDENVGLNTTGHDLSDVCIYLSQCWHALVVVFRARTLQPTKRSSLPVQARGMCREDNRIRLSQVLTNDHDRPRRAVQRP